MYDMIHMIWYGMVYDTWYDMILLFNGNLVDTRWQQYSTVQYTFTHKQYTEQHNETEYTERNIHNNKNT